MKNRIKELRKANKLSQSELADIVGTTRQTITSIEVGNSHEQNSTYSVFMHVCEAWQPLLSLQIYSNNQLQMV